MKKLTLLSILTILAFQLSAQKWKEEVSSYYFYIRVATSPTMFWDLPGEYPESTKAGVQLQISDGNKDKREQSFIFPDISGTEYFAIMNKADLIIDVDGKVKLTKKEQEQRKAGREIKSKKAKGAAIIMETLDAKVPEWQQWKIIVVGKNNVIFENVYAKRKFISVENGMNSVNGTKLISSYPNLRAQMFQLEYAEGKKKGQILEFNDEDIQQMPEGENIEVEAVETEEVVIE